MIDGNLVAICEGRIKKAKTEYNAAVSNMDNSFFDVANTRAYYSMFHAIRAILALDDIDFKTHIRTIGYFNKNYVNTNKLDTSLNKIVFNASTSRNGSDYEDNYFATREEVEENINGVRKLLTAIERYIKNRLKSEPIQDELNELGSESDHTKGENEEDEDLEP